MHLNERTALNNSEKTIEPEDVYHAAQAIFRAFRLTIWVIAAKPTKIHLQDNQGQGIR